MYLVYIDGDNDYMTETNNLKFFSLISVGKLYSHNKIFYEKI